MGMRRFGLTLAAAALFVAAAPGAASANHHLIRFSEVFIASDTGDTNVRFIELDNQFLEPFPTNQGPYSLRLFNATGAEVGSILLDMNPQATNSLILVGGPKVHSELGKTPDFNLTTDLPEPRSGVFRGRQLLHR